MKIGEVVKQRVEALGMSKTELARRLHMSPANIHKIFKRNTIDAALLHRLGVILDYNFFNHFKDPEKAGQPVPARYDEQQDIEVLFIRYFVDLESRVRILEQRWENFRATGKVEEAMPVPYLVSTGFGHVDLPALNRPVRNVRTKFYVSKYFLKC